MQADIDRQIKMAKKVQAENGYGPAAIIKLQYSKRRFGYGFNFAKGAQVGDTYDDGYGVKITVVALV